MTVISMSVAPNIDRTRHVTVTTRTEVRDEVAEIACPTLVAVGTHDDIAGDPAGLAALMPSGRAVDIEGRDHNKAVGDKAYKAAVLEFLEERP